MPALPRLPAALLAGAALLTPFAHAADDSADVRQKLERRIGGSVDEVRKTPYLGLYEARLGDRLIYTDPAADYIFSGSILDARTRTNLSQERLDKLSAIAFADLPLDLAVKTVRGDGKRVLATFEDPNCGFCRKLAKELEGLDNVTIYTFLLPILSPDSEDKARAVWCARDRAQAWRELMLSGKAPAAASCDTPLGEISAFAQKHRIQATPTLFLSSGERIAGAVPRAQLEQRLARAR